LLDLIECYATPLVGEFRLHQGNRMILLLFVAREQLLSD
jgi:hypothetical protein